MLGAIPVPRPARPGLDRRRAQPQARGQRDEVRRRIPGLERDRVRIRNGDPDRVGRVHDVAAVHRDHRRLAGDHRVARPGVCRFAPRPGRLVRTAIAPCAPPREIPTGARAAVARGAARGAVARRVLGRHAADLEPDIAMRLAVELARRHPAADALQVARPEHVGPRRAVRRRQGRAAAGRHHQRHVGPRRNHRVRRARRRAQIAQRERPRAGPRVDIGRIGRRICRCTRRRIADHLDHLAGAVRPHRAPHHQRAALQVRRRAPDRRQLVGVRRPGQRVRHPERAVRHVVRGDRPAARPPRVAAQVEREPPQVVGHLPVGRQPRHRQPRGPVSGQPVEQRHRQRQRHRAPRQRRIEVIRLALAAPPEVGRIDLVRRRHAAEVVAVGRAAPGEPEQRHGGQRANHGR